jgi:hypothetical protein
VSDQVITLKLLPLKDDVLVPIRLRRLLKTALRRDRLKAVAVQPPAEGEIDGLRAANAILEASHE